LTLRATRRILDEQPDLVVLDRTLPGKDGLAVLRGLCAKFFGSQTSKTRWGVIRLVNAHFGSGDGNLYAVNPDGTARWVFATSSSEILGNVAIGPDRTVYLGSGNDLYAVGPP
jgi:hypothetical protein